MPFIEIARILTKEIYPLSVVIATLGGDSLPNTLATLNSGSAIPAEILICIPEREAGRVTALQRDNVRVVVTPCRGQVAQRAFGFGQTGQPLVLQMDDDILIEPAHLRALIESLQRLGRGNVVAPIYRDLGTRCLHTYMRGWSGRVQDVYAAVICGAKWGMRRMGTVSPAGVSYGVDEKLCSEPAVQTEWLPGGCVLSFREDLVTEAFFPFPGKAYCEDLIHSILRRHRGLKLWVLPQLYCQTAAPPPQVLTWKEMRNDLRARRHVVQLAGGSQMRLALWFAADALRRGLRTLLPRRRQPG
ncbi:glycosyltransferase [Steroidobacter flavus]|uniref:Glycosyltransferase n=1 Tax=Steroidobacter flavus TaxID=1842136 RepID=A0ABV8T2A2_9GAMM